MKRDWFKCDKAIICNEKHLSLSCKRTMMLVRPSLLGTGLPLLALLTQLHLFPPPKKALLFKFDKLITITIWL